jgi:hypothetical protein
MAATNILVVDDDQENLRLAVGHPVGPGLHG